MAVELDVLATKALALKPPVLLMKPAPDATFGSSSTRDPSDQMTFADHENNYSFLRQNNADQFDGHLEVNVLGNGLC